MGSQKKCFRLLLSAAVPAVGLKFVIIRPFYGIWASFRHIF